MEGVLYACQTCPWTQEDADYVPGQEDSELMANDEEEDRNMAALTTREPRLEQIDRSKEMDTVAKYVTHPYNLRSIHQAERELISHGHVGIGEGAWCVCVCVCTCVCVCVCVCVHVHNCYNISLEPSSLVTSNALIPRDRLGPKSKGFPVPNMLSSQVLICSSVCVH